MTDIVERLREVALVWRAEEMGTLVAEAADEIERLRAMVLDACEVFDHYDHPEHAFHYRRAILGLDEAKRIARTHLTT